MAGFRQGKSTIIPRNINSEGLKHLKEVRKMGVINRDTRKEQRIPSDEDEIGMEVF